jgi:hypothetical protein
VPVVGQVADPITGVAQERRVGQVERRATGQLGRRGEVQRRLAVIRGERNVRVWLNDRRVTRAVDRSRPKR